MDSKGMELSINIIVIAVIALLVLVVVIAIFAGQMGGFTTGVRDCTSKGGTCTDKNSACPDGYTTFFGSGVCPTEQKCCVVIGSGCIAKRGIPGGECMTKIKSECNEDCKWVGE